MAARLVLDIIANASNAVKGLSDVDKAAGKTGTSVEASGKKISGLAKGLATGLAVGAVVKFGSASVAAAQESAVAGARLEQVFRSMGDTTGRAAKSAEDYAGSLSKKIGVDDEAIQAGQALLATFANVSNETARTAGIFDRATAAGADLAAAGFGTIESNAVQLGKALNDPIKGITALARSGVTFTAAQKQQIAALTKSGHLLDAQKIVLKAVETQVGGTAAATVTGAQKQAVAMDQLQETIGAGLLPIVTQLQGTFAGLFGFMAANAGWLTPLIVGLAVFGATIFVVTKAIAAWKAITVAWMAITKVAAAVQLAFNLAMWLFPGLIIVGAILAVIGVLVLLYVKVAWVRAFVQAAFTAIVNAGLFLWHALVAAFNAVISWVRGNWPLLVGILFGPFGIAVALIIKNWSTITAFFGALPGRIGGLLSSVVGFIVRPFESAWSAVQSSASAVAGWFAAIPGKIAGALSGVFDAIVSPFESAWNWVQNNIFGPIKSVWNGIAGALNSIHISLKVPSFVPGIGGKGWEWNGPNLPMLASGGIVRSPTLALIGERGPEAVIPLGRGTGSGTTVLNVTVNVPPSANPAQIGAQVVRVLKAYTRANGPITGLTA